MIGPPEDEEEYWTVREYYNGGGNYSVAITPAGDTLEELRQCLMDMLNDLDRYIDLDSDTPTKLLYTGDLDATS